MPLEAASYTCLPTVPVKRSEKDGRLIVGQSTIKSLLLSEKKTHADEMPDMNMAEWVQ